MDDSEPDSQRLNDCISLKDVADKLKYDEAAGVIKILSLMKKSSFPVLVSSEDIIYAFFAQTVFSVKGYESKSQLLQFAFPIEVFDKVRIEVMVEGSDWIKKSANFVKNYNETYCLISVTVINTLDDSNEKFHVQNKTELIWLRFVDGSGRSLELSTTSSCVVPGCKSRKPKREKRKRKFVKTLPPVVSKKPKMTTTVSSDFFKEQDMAVSSILDQQQSEGGNKEPVTGLCFFDDFSEPKNVITIADSEGEKIKLLNSLYENLTKIIMSK